MEKETEETVKDIISGHEDPERYKSVRAWICQCFYRPSKHEIILCALNEVLGGHGVESLIEDGSIIASYVNVGDPYKETVVLDYETGEFCLTSYGDFYEEWLRENLDSDCPHCGGAGDSEFPCGACNNTGLSYNYRQRTRSYEP